MASSHSSYECTSISSTDSGNSIPHCRISIFSTLARIQSIPKMSGKLFNCLSPKVITSICKLVFFICPVLRSGTRICKPFTCTLPERLYKEPSIPLIHTGFSHLVQGKSCLSTKSISNMEESAPISTNASNESSFNCPRYFQLIVIGKRND